MTEPALFSLENQRGSRPLDVVSWGAGVESSAYLTEILTKPTRHDVDPQNLVVLHAVVGSEFTDTLTLSQRFILPLLADRGVRLVQLSRRGRHERDGIEILDDSTTPKVMHHTGPWTLAQHNAVNGFTPQLSDRRCSLQFKGFVLDRFILSEFTGRPYRHVIGYNRDETSRARNDLVFATQTRQPVHPLIEWDWSRQRCSQLLTRKFGVTWPKSACGFCPFAGSAATVPSLMLRMQRDPARAVEALLTEYRALFFNPRSKMFGRFSLHDRLVEHHIDAVLVEFERRLECAQWTVYDVRRLFFARGNDPTSKGPAWRSTRARFTGTRAPAGQWLRDHAGEPTDPDGRVWLRGQTPSSTYPRVEHFIGATLEGTADKQRRSFDKQWSAVTGDKLFDLA